MDTVLDDSFQLISLFFLTVGKNNEAPAMYDSIYTKLGVSLTVCRYSMTATITVSASLIALVWLPLTCR